MTSRKNRGKLFENEIRESLIYFGKKYPLYFLRIPDYRTVARMINASMAGTKRPCDLVININGVCCLWELKQSSDPNSFPFNNVKEHQIDELKKNKAAGGLSYILINWRPEGKNDLKSFGIEISAWEKLVRETTFKTGKPKKSITWDELEKNPLVLQLERKRLFKGDTKSSLSYGWNLEPLLCSSYVVQKTLPAFI